MTVRRLLSEMDSRELTAWMAYATVEPFGVERDNLHAGIVAATVANVNRPKGAKPFQPGQFLLDFGQRKEEPDEAAQMQAMYAQMALIAQAQNAIVEAEIGAGEAGESNAGGEAAQAD